MPEEIELKLTAHPDFEPDRLLERLSKRAQVEPRDTVAQRDVYYDTRAAELREAGLSARVRHRADGRKLEVKPVPIALDLVMSRAEISRTLDADEDTAGAVAALAEQLGVPLRGRPEPVLELHTQRRPFEVRRNGMKAELAIDRVQVHHREGEARGQFLEVELELEEGEPGEILSLAEVMHGDGLEPSLGSKYVRAREILGLPAYRYGAPPYEYTADTPVDEVARRVCLRQLAVMRSYEPGTRVGLDTEHLHKMRVATRRFRTALRVFRDFLPKDERKHANKEMRWLGRKLGVVRDLDVHLLALPQWRRRFGPEPATGWDALAQALGQRRERAQALLRDALDSQRRRAFEEWLEPTLAQGPGSGPPVGKAAKEILREQLARFEQGVQRFEQTHDPQDAHQLRILGKRLRYSVEFFRPLLDDEVRSRIKRLEAFQDTLGDLQDMIAAGELARELAEQTYGDRSLLYVLGVLDGAAHVSTEHARVRVDQAVESLAPGKLVREVLSSLG